VIVKELQVLVDQNRNNQQNPSFIKNLLKEYLQSYLLNFIFLNKQYNQAFIFTGGTCLRHCFDMNRLSEDLDFDVKTTIDIEKFKEALENYFHKEYLYSALQISVRQRGWQILLKFPVLKQLKLAYKEESDLLYVKIDLSPVCSNHFQLQTTLKSIGHFNYLVIHYDLPSLMAEKLHAILRRTKLVGVENASAIKGRDYYDLLWFMEKKITPNLDRLNDLLKESLSLQEVMAQVDEKVKEATSTKKRFFKQDLLPFINNPLILEGYIGNYQDNYERNKQYLLE